MQLLKVISFKIVCYFLCQVSLYSVINLTVVDSLIPRYKVQGGKVQIQKQEDKRFIFDQ